MNKTRRVTFRLTNAELAAVRLMAIEEQRSFADMLRQLIRSEMGRRGMPSLISSKYAGVLHAGDNQ